MSKGNLVAFPYEYGEEINLVNIDQLSDGKLFNYEEEISNMIVNGIDAGEQDFLEECRNVIIDEIKRRYFEMKKENVNG